MTGPSPIPATPAGTARAAGNRVWRLRRPPSTPPELYRNLLTTPIPNPANNKVVSATGAAIVTVGPQGLGTTWQCRMAAISTTIGANDPSTCTIYIGSPGFPYQGFATQVGGQSYAGGGDAAGLNDVVITPGTAVIAIWAGGTSGSTATLVIYGTQTVLVP